jgi:hypothetical protein
MAWAHPVALVVKELSREEAFDIAMGTRPRLRLRCKLALDAIPRLKVDDCAVQAVVDLALVAKSSDIDRVREDPVDVATRDQAAARRFARSNNSNRQSHIFCIENGLHPPRVLPSLCWSDTRQIRTFLAERLSILVTKRGWCIEGRWWRAIVIRGELTT